MYDVVRAVSVGFVEEELSRYSGLAELLPDLLGLLTTLLCVLAIPSSAVDALSPRYSTR